MKFRSKRVMGELRDHAPVDDIIAMLTLDDKEQQSWKEYKNASFEMKSKFWRRIREQQY